MQSREPQGETVSPQGKDRAGLTVLPASSSVPVNGEGKPWSWKGFLGAGPSVPLGRKQE